MGIFSRKKKTENPQNSLSSSPLFRSNMTAAGVFISETNAMRTAAVYACVRVLAEAVASLPLNIYRRVDDGQKVAYDHNLQRILHNEPNPKMTSFVFRETLMSHLLLWGNAYAQIIRDGGGRVRALYPLAPDRISVNCDETGNTYYTYWYGANERRGQDGGNQVILRDYEVMHIPGLSYDGLIGYSTIDLARSAIGMAVATENYGASFFANGAVPSGVLEHTGSIRDEQAVREAWNKLHQGTGRGNNTAILEDGMTYHVVSTAPEQAQFLETRKFQIDEICRIFRVPPHMIADLEKSSFSNIEQQSLEFVKFSLDPWITRWEQSMYQSLLLPSEKDDYFIKFNLDGLLRGDYETRMKGYSIGIQNGIMSPNDIRRLENMNLIPAEEGGDNYIVNGNMTKLRDVGAAYAKSDNM